MGLLHQLALPLPCANTRDGLLFLGPDILALELPRSRRQPDPPVAVMPLHHLTGVTSVVGVINQRRRALPIHAHQAMPSTLLDLSSAVNPTTAARLIGCKGQLGVVAPRAEADRLAVDGDPLAESRADPARRRTC